MIETVLTAWRLKWYSRGALLALAVAFVVILVTGSGTTTLTGRVGGDYPAFYSAGQIIADGQAETLYSPRQQRAYPRSDLVAHGVELLRPHRAGIRQGPVLPYAGLDVGAGVAAAHRDRGVVFANNVVPGPVWC